MPVLVEIEVRFGASGFGIHLVDIDFLNIAISPKLKFFGSLPTDPEAVLLPCP